MEYLKSSSEMRSAFVMMFRLVKRVHLHLPILMQPATGGTATVERTPPLLGYVFFLSSRRCRRRLLKPKLTHSVDVVFGTGKSAR